jgi:hypothetical protein
MSRIVPAPIIGESAASGAQVIDGSLRFDDDKKNYLTRTPSSAGNNKTFTFSTWTKGLGDGTFFCNGVASTGDNGLYIMISSGSLYVGTWTTSWQWYVDTNRLFRDDGWYHLVVSVDTTISSPASDRVKLYVNGVQETSFATANYPSQNYDTLINNTAAHAIGRQGELDSHYIDKKLSQVYFIDGAQLGPEYFGFTDPLTNTWRPKKFKSSINNGTTWSSGISGTLGGSSVTVENPERAFNGNTSNSAQFNTTQNDPGILTWTVPGGGISASNFRIFTYQPQTLSGMTYEMSINGGAYVQDAGNWATVAVNGDGWSTLQTVPNGLLTSIALRSTYTSGGSTVRIYAIEVDGVVLIDGATNDFGTNGFYLPFDGNSPIGEDKSGIVTPNNGSIWSNSLTSSSGFRSSEPKTNAFDGNTSSICSAVGSGTITFTSPVTFASNSTIRVFLHGGDHTVTVNGGSNQTISAGSFQTVTYSNSGNATFTMTFHRGGGADTGVRAIEIDGVILTDGLKGNSFTPVNFGGSVELDKATGALPILNTTQGGTQATVGVRTDAHANNLFLAVPLVGSTNDVSNQINSGSTTKIATSSSVDPSSTQSNFYAGSHHWSANSDTLQYAEQGDELVFGTGDFTIELWFYDDGGHNGGGGGRCYLFDNRIGGSVVGDPPTLAGWVDNSNEINLYASSTIEIQNVDTNNRWIHYAAVRSSGTVTLYIDGVAKARVSDTTNYTNNGIGVGRATDGGYGWAGYIQDFRVYKGVAKYTENFIPASTNPDILPDTPSGVSGSSKLTKITDGSVAFDGTGDDLHVADSADFEFGTGDFTIECFAYHTVDSDDHLISKYGSSNATRSWRLVSDGNQKIIFYWYYSTDSSLNITSAAGKFSLNRWHHIVAQRTSGDIYLFVDGELVGSNTSSGAAAQFNDNSTAVDIAGDSNGSSQDFPGFISNVRIVKGTGVYNTTGFTPPTAPLTNVTNTKLLCCQSPTNVRLSPVGPNVGITTTTRFNSNFESIPTTVNGLTVTNNGSVSTTSAGTNSYGFTNCADLTASNSLSVDLGTIPAVTTIDIIFKATGATDNKYLFGIGGNGMVRRSSSNFAWYNGSDTTISTSEIVDGNWHHLRVTPTRLFFDNTLITNSTSLQFINNNTVSDGDNSGHMALGAFRNGSGTIQYNASVDFGLVRVMPGVDLGAPSSYPITTNGTLSDTETISNDGIIVARGNSAATNFNPFNTDINTVRGQETGYPTMSPLAKNSSITLTDGNLHIASTDSHGQKKIVYSTAQIPNDGKWYVEWHIGGPGCTLGFGKNGSVDWSGSDTQLGTNTYSWGYEPNGNLFHNGNQGGSYGSSSAGDVIGMTIDTSGSTVTAQWYKNGVLIRNSSDTAAEFTGIARGDYIVMMSQHSPNYDTVVNFGQKPFKFPPPEGFQPLNATNIRPETVIARPDKFVNTTLWSGNNADPREIDCGHQPDLIWVKTRNQTNWNWLSDSLRGTADKRYKLYSNSTNAQDTAPIYGQADSFVSNGWIAGGGTDGSNPLSDSNQTGTNYVCWSWKAGGNKNTFNIDDVGYANASDVNMSVGALNSATYNTSENWLTTGTITGTPHSAPYTFSPLFDGDLTGLGPQSNSTSTQYVYTFGSALSATADSIIFYSTSDAANVPAGSGAFYINGTQVTTSNCTKLNTSSPYKYRMDGLTTLSSIGTQQRGNMTGIEVNGKLLIDSNAHTPPNLPSIAPTGCSAGTKQGFSIIKYAGTDTGSSQTIPHGLNEPPVFWMFKNLSQAADWIVYTTAIDGGSDYLKLNGTDAANPGVSPWSTAPTNSVITVGTNNVDTCNDGDNYVMYAWHDVPGLQKFGSFEGNGNNDGPFVELGFEPAVILTKNIDNYGTNYDWCIYDNTRSTFNPNDKFLCPNLNKQENVRGDGNTDNARYVDFLSNGFKIRNNSSPVNLNAHTIIYAAWAAAPAVNLYGGRSNAR